MVSGQTQHAIEALRDQRRLPVRDVVGTEIAWRWPGHRAVRDTREARCPDPRGPQRRYTQARAEHVVQVLLLGVVVLAFAGNGHAERVAVERQRRVRVVDDDRRVVDAEKQRDPSSLPLLQPFPGGKCRISRKCPSGSRK